MTAWRQVVVIPPARAFRDAAGADPHLSGTVQGLPPSLHDEAAHVEDEVVEVAVVAVRWRRVWVVAAGLQPRQLAVQVG